MMKSTKQGEKQKMIEARELFEDMRARAACNVKLYGYERVDVVYTSEEWNLLEYWFGAPKTDFEGLNKERFG